MKSQMLTRETYEGLRARFRETIRTMNSEWISEGCLLASAFVRYRPNDLSRRGAEIRCQGDYCDRSLHGFVIVCNRLP